MEQEQFGYKSEESLKIGETPRRRSDQWRISWEK